MKKIHFLTGNINKYEEAKRFIPNLEMLKIDLFEIQETNPKRVIEEKLRFAMNQGFTNIIVDDTGLSFEVLNGFPGPLIKWLGTSISNKEIYEMLKKLGNTKAWATTILGFANEDGGIAYFEGVLNGEIVEPRGQNGFGWDEIFQPSETNKTLAEMTMEEKNMISPRKEAFQKLAEFLKIKSDLQ